MTPALPTSNRDAHDQVIAYGKTVGVLLSAADAEWLLWECTGWPGFFMGDTVEARAGYFWRQIDEAVARIRKARESVAARGP